jgi:hypothetical protein
MASPSEEKKSRKLEALMVISIMDLRNEKWLLTRDKLYGQPVNSNQVGNPPQRNCEPISRDQIRGVLQRHKRNEQQF